MTDHRCLYEPWHAEGSFLNRMLHVGGMAGSWGTWFTHALRHLPLDVFDDIKEMIMVVSTGHVDGCRVPPDVQEGRELVLISDRVLPKSGSSGDQPEVRYFVVTVLHEIAHVVCRHRSPRSISTESNSTQEDEARTIALEWFNLAGPKLGGEFQSMDDNEYTRHEQEFARRREEFYKGGG